MSQRDRLQYEIDFQLLLEREEQMERICEIDQGNRNGDQVIDID